MRSLSALQDLRELTLSCSSLGDEGLEFVPKLGHLEFLMLRGGQRVTDAGISHVSRSGTINWLCLYTPHLTDDALASIANLSTLEDLSVSGGAMTEIGIAKLAVVPRLMRLEFITNKVTDGIATAFSKLKALRLLVLYRAPLGPNALAILKAANPGLSIPD